MKKVLILSSSLLTDRMLLYSDWLPALAKRAEAVVWAASAANPKAAEVWRSARARVEPLPKANPFPEFPHNVLRRLNDFAWDIAKPRECRRSIGRHIKRKTMPWWLRTLRAPAALLAAAGSEQRFEGFLERYLIRYRRSPEARERLSRERFDLVVATGPFFDHEPPVVMEARRLGIPVMAFITSWDNITTKNRMVFEYDAYAVWSSRMVRELREFYPKSASVSVRVVGAIQYDIFFRSGLSESRREFCARYEFDPGKPMVLYCLGSPNLLREYHGALEFARAVMRGDVGDIQMLVRLHPIQDYGAQAAQFAGFRPRVVVQDLDAEASDRKERTQDLDQVRLWVNSFRHADVVINTASTVLVDAAIFDRPVVNLAFDPEPGSPNHELIEDITFRWDHMRPIAESGGIWNVRNMEELLAATRDYLREPARHRAERRWIARYVCGPLDGRCGQRMAEMVLEVLSGTQPTHRLKALA